ncbi:MAG: hypothetical protein OXG35_15930 [Acidobacteria bacterium]|nr:hypothetical protein [Acidobacteriota bacterium]
MTRSQSIALKMSEKRERLNALLDIEDRDDSQTAERDTLAGELQALEPEYRAALVAEGVTETATDDGLDAEARERLELRSKATLGGLLLAALQGRVASGAEAEYAAAFKAPAGHIPIDLFEADRPVEERATTSAPSTGTGVTVAPVQPFVFAPSIAPMLGIDMPSVGSGGYSEMTVSTAVQAAARAKGNDDDFSAAALTPVNATARRISARLSLTLEDIATVGQANFESALRQNVSMALSAEYDDQCINGNSTAPNINGLINQLTDPTDPTGVAAFDDWVTAFADQVDGLWAPTVRDVAMIVNVDAYKLAAKSFRGAATAGAPNQTAADYLREATGGFSTNSRMPATDSTLARGIVYRMGRPGLRTASHPTWGTISLDDPYSDSRSATRHFTVHMLVGSRVLIVQPGAYSLAEFKVSA